MTSLKQIHCIH